MIAFLHRNGMTHAHTRSRLCSARKLARSTSLAFPVCACHHGTYLQRPHRYGFQQDVVTCIVAPMAMTHRFSSAVPTPGADSCFRASLNSCLAFLAHRLAAGLTSGANYGLSCQSRKGSCKLADLTDNNRPLHAILLVNLLQLFDEGSMPCGQILDGCFYKLVKNVLLFV